MSKIQGRSEKELVLVFVVCDLRTFDDKVAEVSIRSEDNLFFPAGKVVEVGAMGVDVGLGSGMALKIFSATQPEVPYYTL